MRTRNVLTIVLTIAMVFAMTPMARAEQTYNFDDGTVQGWTVTTGLVWIQDGNSIEAGKYDTDLTTVMRAHDGYDGDPLNPTFVFTSPAFYLDPVSTNDLTATLEGGDTRIPNPLPTLTDVLGVPEALFEAGFMGFALRNITTDTYEFWQTRGGSGGGATLKAITAGQLDTLDPNAQYAIDFIDYNYGGWGWTRFDNVSIPGTQNLIATLTWDGDVGEWGDIDGDAPGDSHWDGGELYAIPDADAATFINSGQATVVRSGQNAYHVGVTGGNLRILGGDLTTNTINSATEVAIGSGGMLTASSGTLSSALIGTGNGTISNSGDMTIGSLAILDNSTLIKQGAGKLTASANGTIGAVNTAVKVSEGELSMMASDVAGIELDGGTMTVISDTLIIPSFRYYKFTAAETADGTMQYSAMEYFNGDVWTQATTATYNLSWWGSESPDMANDNNDGTKFATADELGDLIYDFGAPTSFDEYNWRTANDSTPARNPIRWSVEGRNVDTDPWTMIDDRTGAVQTTPGATHTWAGPTNTRFDGYALSAFGPISMLNTTVTVTNDSTLNALSTTADFGALSFITNNDSTLNLTGAPEGITFTGVTFDTGNVNKATINAPMSVNLGAINDGGSNIEIVKTGAGDLVLDVASTIGTGSKFNVSGSNMVVTDSTSLGSAGVELNGAGLVLDTTTHAPDTFNNDVTSAGGGNTLTAGQAAGSELITLSGPLTVNAPLALNTFGDHSLAVTGALSGAGAVKTDGAVTIGAAGGTIGSLAVTSGVTNIEAPVTTTLLRGLLNSVLNGSLYAGDRGEGELNFQGNYDPSDPHFNGGGGILSITPTDSGTLSGAVGIADGNTDPFQTRFDEPGDQWQALWTGLFVPDVSGTWTFRIAYWDNPNNGNIDDHGSFYLDQDRNNNFGSGEGTQAGDGRTLTYDLVAGEAYPFATSFNEDSGGEWFGAFVQGPGGSTIGSMTRIDTSTMAGFFGTEYGYATIVTNAILNINVGGSLDTPELLAGAGADVNVDGMLATLSLVAAGGGTVDVTDTGTLDAVAMTVRNGSTVNLLADATVAHAGGGTYTVEAGGTVNASTALGEGGGDAINLDISGAYNAKVLGSLGQGAVDVRNGGTVSIDIDGAAAGANIALEGGALIAFNALQSTFPSMTIPGDSGIGGNLTGALWVNAAPTLPNEVQLLENAVVAMNPTEGVKPTHAVFGSTLVEGIVDRTATYTWGTNTSVFKGGALGAWTNWAAPANDLLEITVESDGSAEAEIAMIGYTAGLTASTTFNMDIDFTGNGLVRFDAAPGGTGTVITRTAPAGNTGNIIVDLNGGVDKIASGKTLNVVGGVLRMNNSTGAVFGLNATPLVDRGTAHIQAGASLFLDDQIGNGAANGFQGEGMGVFEIDGANNPAGPGAIYPTHQDRWYETIAVGTGAGAVTVGDGFTQYGNIKIHDGALFYLQNDDFDPSSKFLPTNVIYVTREENRNKWTGAGLVLSDGGGYFTTSTQNGAIDDDGTGIRATGEHLDIATPQEDRGTVIIAGASVAGETERMMWLRDDVDLTVNLPDDADANTLDNYRLNLQINGDNLTTLVGHADNESAIERFTGDFMGRVEVNERLVAGNVDVMHGEFKLYLNRNEQLLDIHTLTAHPGTFINVDNHGGAVGGTVNIGKIVLDDAQLHWNNQNRYTETLMGLNGSSIGEIHLKNGAFIYRWETENGDASYKQVMPFRDGDTTGQTMAFTFRVDGGEVANPARDVILEINRGQTFWFPDTILGTDASLRVRKRDNTNAFFDVTLEGDAFADHHDGSAGDDGTDFGLVSVTASGGPRTLTLGGPKSNRDMILAVEGMVGNDVTLNIVRGGLEFQDDGTRADLPSGLASGAIVNIGTDAASTYARVLLQGGFDGTGGITDGTFNLGTHANERRIVARVTSDGTAKVNAIGATVNVVNTGLQTAVLRAERETGDDTDGLVEFAAVNVEAGAAAVLEAADSQLNILNLHVDGSLDLGGMTLNLNDLSGSGALTNGTANVLALAPGSSAGTLTADNLTMVAASTYEFEFTALGADSVDLTGALTGGDWTLNAYNVGGLGGAEDDAVLFSYGSTSLPDGPIAGATLNLVDSPANWVGWSIGTAEIINDSANNRVIIAGLTSPGFISKATGNYNDTGTWLPSSIATPNVSSVVKIENGDTVTVAAAGNAYRVYVNNGELAANAALTVGNKIDLAAAGTLTVGAGPVTTPVVNNVGGTLNVNGSLTAPAVNLTGGTANFDAAATLAVGALNVSGTTVTTTGMSGVGTVVMGSGELSVSGNVTVTGEITLDGGLLRKTTTSTAEVSAATFSVKGANLNVEGGELILTGLKASLDGMVGYWSFDDGNGNDASGNGYNGSEYGPVTYSDTETPTALSGGKSLNLTGGSAAIGVDDTDSAFDGGQSMTIAYWAKGNTGGGWQPYVGKNGEGDGWQSRKHGDGPNMDWTLRGAGGDWQVANSAVAFNDEWHFIVNTYDGAKKESYIYGADLATPLYEQAAATGDISPSVNRMMFGARDNNTSGLDGWMNGYLDDIRFFNRAISQDEIEKLYANAVGASFGDLTMLTDTTLTIGGSDEVTFASINAAGGVEITGNVVVSGALGAGNDLTITGDATFKGAATAGTGALIDGNLAIDGSYAPAGNSTITGDLTVSGTITPAGGVGGTLTVGVNMDMVAGSNYDWATRTGAVGTTDTVTVVGELNAENPFNVVLNISGAINKAVDYTLFTYGSLVGDPVANITLVPPPGSPYTDLIDLDPLSLDPTKIIVVPGAITLHLTGVDTALWTDADTSEWGLGTNWIGGEPTAALEIAAVVDSSVNQTATVSLGLAKDADILIVDKAPAAATGGKVLVDDGTLTITNNTHVMAGGSFEVTAATGTFVSSGDTTVYDGGALTVNGQMFLSDDKNLNTAGTTEFGAVSRLDLNAVAGGGGTLNITGGTTTLNSGALITVNAINATGGLLNANSNLQTTTTLLSVNGGTVNSAALTAAAVNVTSGSLTSVGAATADAVSISGGSMTTQTGLTVATTLDLTGGSLISTGNVSADTMNLKGGTFEAPGGPPVLVSATTDLAARGSNVAIGNGGQLTIDVTSGGLPGGLRLWLDASNAGSLWTGNDVDGWVQAVDTDEVTRWDDLSGNGFNVTHDNIDELPTYNAAVAELNGQAALHFDDDMLSRANDIRISGNDDRTLITIWANAEDTGQHHQHTFHHGDASGNEAYGHSVREVNDSGGYIANHYWGAEFITTVASSADPTIAISTWDGDAGTGANGLDSWWINGAFAGASDRAALATGTDQLNVGSRLAGADEGIRGDIAEILMFDRALSPAELNMVGAFLATKYNVSTGYAGPLMPSFGNVSVGDNATFTLGALGEAIVQEIDSGINASIDGDIIVARVLRPGVGGEGQLNIINGHGLTVEATTVYTWDTLDDLVSVTGIGALTLADGWTLKLEEAGAPIETGTSYTLFNYDGTIGTLVATLDDAEVPGRLSVNVDDSAVPGLAAVDDMFVRDDGAGEVSLYIAPTQTWDHGILFTGNFADTNWPDESGLKELPNIRIEDGDVTVAGTYTGADSALTVGVSGGSLTVNGELNVIRTVDVSGTGTVTVANAGTLTAPALNVTGDGTANFNAGSTAVITTVNATGGEVNIASATGATLNVDGGTVNTTDAGASATDLQMKSGLVDLAGGNLTVATATLNGGVMDTKTNALVVGGSGEVTLKNGVRFINDATSFQIVGGNLVDPSAGDPRKVMISGGGTVEINAENANGYTNGFTGSIFEGIPQNDVAMNLDGAAYTVDPDRVLTGVKANTVLARTEVAGQNVTWNGKLEDDSDFDMFPGYGEPDDFVWAFSGVFKPALGGVYNFRWSVDDRGAMYLDHDDNGVFEASDEVGFWDWNGAGATGALVADQEYKYLWMGQDFGGNQPWQVWMTPPGGSEVIVDSTVQSGQWLRGSRAPAANGNMPYTEVHATGAPGTTSTVSIPLKDLNGDPVNVPVTLGGVTTAAGATLVVDTLSTDIRLTNMTLGVGSQVRSSVATAGGGLEVTIAVSGTLSGGNGGSSSVGDAADLFVGGVTSLTLTATSTYEHRFDDAAGAAYQFVQVYGALMLDDGATIRLLGDGFSYGYDYVAMLPENVVLFQMLQYGNPASVPLNVAGINIENPNGWTLGDLEIIGTALVINVDTVLPGDADNDGDVDGDDWTIFKAQFGGAPSPADLALMKNADFDRNNRVDLRDLAILDAAWGADGGPSAPELPGNETPEPATMSLLAIGGLLVLRRRRRKA